MNTQKYRPLCLLLILLLLVTGITGCATEAAQTEQTPLLDESEEYRTRIAELEAEIQKQREERYISDFQYNTRIKELQSRLEALGTDTDISTDAGKNGDELIFSYRLEGEKAIITGYEGSSTLVTVPATIDGYPVIAIGERAFENQALAAVVLPEGLEVVGWFAFYGCEALIDITIPASVTSIGYAVFDGCPNISIVCTAGSYAEQYAKSYGLPCVST